MPKSKTAYVCSACGHSTPRWNGKCPGCGEWHTLQETLLEPKASAGTSSNRHAAWAGTSGVLRKLKDVKPQEIPRISTGLGELDRVLGGGLVQGSVILIAGDPGIGKSTLLLQTTVSLASQLKTIYVTGEESPEQISLRAERLGLSNSDMHLVSEIDLERIMAIFETEKPRLVVIDSIQTVYHPDLQSAPGFVSQVKECAAHLTRFAKTTGCIVFLVGHVTKDGSIAGPRVLEHIIDGSLYFEGESGTSFRMLRALKNRFGTVNELGVFAMGDKGLEEVSNPSSLFLTQHEEPVPGCAIMAAMEGNRPLLVEVQALIEESPSPNPRRFSSGFDLNRLQMLLAVLNKHIDIQAFQQNVYLKVVGGVRITEPAADLPVLLSLYSSLQDITLPGDMVAFGEVGLAGEIRPVQNIEARLKEAAKLGFTKAIIPKVSGSVPHVPGIEALTARTVEAAISLLKRQSTAKKKRRVVEEPEAA